MSDKRVNLDFYAKIKTDVGEVKTVINNIKNQLNDLKLPANAVKGFEKTFENIASEIQNFETISQNGINTLADTKKIDASWKKINNLFGNLGIQLQDLGEIGEQIFPKQVIANIDKANKALNAYQAKINSIRETEAYKNKLKEKNDMTAEANRKASKWQSKQEAVKNKETEVQSKREVWSQNKAAEYQQQQKEIARITSLIDEQNDKLKKQKAIQDQLYEKGITTKEGEVRKSHRDSIKNTEVTITASEKELEQAKKNLALAQEIEKKAKKAKSTAKGKETKLSKKEGADSSKLKAATEAKVKAEKEWNAAQAETLAKTEEVARIEAKLQESRNNLSKLQEDKDLAEQTGRNIAAINEETKALDTSKRAAETAASSNKNYKESLDKNEQELKDQKAALETYEKAMNEAKTKADQLGKELDQMELDGSKAEWNEIVEVIKKFTGIDLSGTQGDIKEIANVLAQYQTKELEKTPKVFEELQKKANGAKPSIEGVTGAISEETRALQDLKHAEREVENLKNQVLDFFSITNTIQIFKNAVRDAFDTVKELDAAMTETAVVTDFSIGDMWDKLPEYSAQATKLGTSIKSLYEATTLYYQQGLNTEQAMGVGIETMKMARVANMDAAAATEAMTAALRGFNMEINETSATRISDVYSELAAITASDTEQIATAMSKTASIAASANMEFETTAALLAQIIETTQEAPETAGTAMKTIIARFTEVKQLFSEGMLTGEDSEGEEININKIDAALKTVGISLKDFLNGTKGIDDIFLELASKWDSLDLATQRYIATTAAGSRQQSRFIAMMSNYERTMELVASANNSAGASQKQFDKTLESLDAKLQRLQNAWDTFTMGLADNELIKAGVDLLTKLLETVNNLTDDLGGAVGGLAKLGIAIGALKVGKGIFDKIFDIKPLKEKVGEVNSLSNLLGAGIKKLADANDKNLIKSVDGATLSMKAFSTGLTIAGVACGAFAQYLRSMGLEEAAQAFEKVGGVLVVVGTGLNFISSAAKAAETSFLGLFAKIGTALSPFLPLILAIGAAIAVVAVALKGFYDKSAAGRLKAAQKDTKKAADAAKEAAEEYNNLKTAIDGIGEKANALNELTKGTQEWRDAVMSLNTEILDLVNTYPELAGFLKNEGGVLKIDYEATKNINGKEQTATEVLNGYFRKQTELQQIYLQNQIAEKEREIYIKFEDINKAGILTVSNFERLQNESGWVESENRKTLDNLAIAIAKGENITNTEDSINNWLSTFSDFQLLYFDRFDYSAMENYGNYLLSQQNAMDGLTDAIIAAQLAMTDFSGISKDSVEAVENFDAAILRDIYQKKAQEVNEKRNILATKEQEEEYAKAHNLTYNPENGEHDRQFRDEENKIVKITNDQILDYFANQETNKEFNEVIQNLSKHLDGITEEQMIMFSEIFKEGTEALSRSTLQKYGTYENGQFGLNLNTKDELAKSMGFTDFYDLATTLEYGEDELAARLNQIFSESGAEFIKMRKNLVNNMTKYSSGNKKDYEVNAETLFLLEQKYQNLDIAGILTDVIGQLELTGDEEFSTAAYESLRDIMMKANGAAEMEEALDFFNTIDFSNPIDSLDKINEEIKTGTGNTKELAIAMKESNSTFLSLSSQISSLTISEDFEDIDEELDEIIEKNGEISAMDVYDLADSYKSLDKILQNNEISAAGLAKILEGLAEGTLKVENLTNTVLAAVSSFDSLNSIAAKTIRGLEEFDLGIDENTVSETTTEWSKLIQENLEKGAVGNTQNFRILDYLFPGWSEGKDGEALVAEQKRLAKLLEGNGQDLRTLWSDIYNGKDYQGNEINFETATDEKFKNMSVVDTGKEILLSGWEGLTSADLVTWISDAYNVSSEMASMMLTDFKNYSTDLAKELGENDYAAGIEKAYESLHQFGDLKLIDKQEIQTIAKILGVNKDKVWTSLVEEYGAIETDFYDDEGNIKSYEYIKQFMDEDPSISGSQAGEKWSESFISSVESGGFGHSLLKTMDMDELEKSLNKVGIIGENAKKIKEQAFESLKSGFEEATSVGYAYITETLANGDKIPIKVTPEMTYEQYQQEVVKQTKLNEDTSQAEAIAAALGKIEISGEISENALIQFRNQVEEIGKETNIELNPSLSEDGKQTIEDEIKGPHEAGVNLEVQNNDIPGYLQRKIVYVDLKVGDNEIPEYYPDAGFATGIKNSTKNYDAALVSEEGPELIQRADGTAYLSGLNGPEITNIRRGDTVYTAEETEDIFKKQSGITMPRYEDGKYVSSYGNGTAYTGSSGGKGAKEEEVWENSFDKLYNLVHKIDEELRQRERIERRYEKLLESIDASANSIIDVSREQLAQLEKERMLQEQLIAGRKYQIEQYQSENADLAQYAAFAENERGEQVLRIDWEAIDAITDEEQGSRVEEYVSQLEEWNDALLEAEDALWEIEDAVQEIKERGKDEYFELEDAIKEAVIQSYQDQIDKLSEINNSINDTNSSLLDAIQKSIDLQRQERENQRTEEDLAKKQRKLLYLQQDTSNANDMEIMQLQKELEEGQEDYTDTLIDQKISELQDQNEEAAKQREQQITLLQSQLDHYIETGAVWNEVYDLMESGLDKETGLVRGSRLEELLKSSEGFEGMSQLARMEWMNDTNSMIAQGLAYLETGRQLEDLGIEEGSQIEFTTEDGKVLTGTVDEDGNVKASNGKVYNNVYQGADGKYYAGSNIEEVETPVVESIRPSGGETTQQASKYTEDNIIGIAEAIWLRGSDATGWGAGDIRKSRVDEKIGAGAGQEVQTRINKIANKSVGTGKAQKDLTEYYYGKFKQGGLADFTGPAWLDGTKSRPEVVLDAQDSRNFIQLRDILSSVLNNGSFSNTSTENNGDITYDIDINVESIGSDYDVEQVANKVKSLIGEDARYRNNNSVSLMR